MIAKNSRIANAYASDSKITKRMRIGLALRKQGKATRQELELMTGIPINVVCPRCKELVGLGYVEQIGNVGSPPRGILALTDKGYQWLGQEVLL